MYYEFAKKKFSVTTFFCECKNFCLGFLGIVKQNNKNSKGIKKFLNKNIFPKTLGKFLLKSTSTYCGGFSK
jgi:hypothetical protein